jgi:hypothetical protein
MTIMTKLTDAVVASKKRSSSFAQIVRAHKKISRGDLICKLDMTPAMFTKEYMDWLQVYRDIKYDKKLRVFYL